MSSDDSPYVRPPLPRDHACQSCHGRKIRCPGERPVCATCVKHQRSCTYPERKVRLSRSERRRLNQQKTKERESGAEALGIALSDVSPPTADHFTDPFQSGTSSHDPLSISTSSSFSLVNDFHYEGLLPGLANPMTTTQAAEFWESFDVNSFLEVASPSAVLADPEDPRVTAWFTPAKREKLYQLYFLHSNLFGLEMHVPSFYSRLASPVADNRPHPCLLLSMLLVTSSSLNLTEGEEKQLYVAAHQAFQEAINVDEKPLCACRAAVLLAVWLMGKGRFPLGWTMIGQAVHLAVCCGLDDIRSSSTKATSKVRTTRRDRISWLGWCKTITQIELAERIYTFWAVFIFDRCAAVGTEFPASLDIKTITTPLPRPWSEYENPNDHLEKCDTHLEDVLNVTHCNDGCGQHDTATARLAKCVFLLYESFMFNHSSTRALHKGGGREGPEAEVQLARLEKAYKAFLTSVPKEMLAVGGEQGARALSATAATWHSMLGTIEMYMYDTDSYEDSNERALEVVKRLVGVVRLLGDDETGDLSLLVLALWERMSRLLVRESRRLDRQGLFMDSARLMGDVQFIIECMKKRGEKVAMAKSLAEEVEFRRTRAPSDIDEDEEYQEP